MNDGEQTAVAMWSSKVGVIAPKFSARLRQRKLEPLYEILATGLCNDVLSTSKLAIVYCMYCMI